MRNVKGPLKDYEICQYDLKGSTINRQTEIKNENLSKIVMKDLNFEEIEKVLVLKDIDVERIRTITSADAYFLTDMSIMDYSLYVVKLSISDSNVI
jgi:hypothetical protein